MNILSKISKYLQSSIIYRSQYRPSVTYLKIAHEVNRKSLIFFKACVLCDKTGYNVNIFVDDKKALSTRCACLCSDCEISPSFITLISILCLNGFIKRACFAK